MPRIRTLPILIVALVLLGCAASDVAPEREPGPAEVPSFQTVDGKRFATEIERNAYLQSTEEARRERALIALEQSRHERIATDLGALQRQRHKRRADAALAEAEAEARSAGHLRRSRSARDRYDAAILAAERREAALRRVEKLARHRAEEPPYQHTPAPWQRLIRYRGADEPLSDFRRRVVDAIRTAQETGGRVEDHL